MQKVGLRHLATASGWPLVVGWGAMVGLLLVVAHRLQVNAWPYQIGPFFLKLFSFLFYIFKNLRNGPRFLGEKVYSTYIFWGLSLHFGRWNLPFLMELRDFIFFQILFLLKLEYCSTFKSIVEILVSWKSEITKNSTTIASIMEIVCTLFLCMAYLSVFGTQVPNMMCITMVQNPKIAWLKNFAPHAVKVYRPRWRKWKITFLPTSNLVISQSMWSTFLKLFSHGLRQDLTN